MLPSGRVAILLHSEGQDGCTADRPRSHPTTTFKVRYARSGKELLCTAFTRRHLHTRQQREAANSRQRTEPRPIKLMFDTCTCGYNTADPYTRICACMYCYQPIRSQMPKQTTATPSMYCDVLQPLYLTCCCRCWHLL
jgi:hypothetical protein